MSEKKNYEKYCGSGEMIKEYGLIKEDPKTKTTNAGSFLPPEID